MSAPTKRKIDKPTSLRILGREWVIEYPDSLRMESEDLLGTCDTDNFTIYVRQNNIEAMRDTLLHEILHALWFVFCVPKKAKEEQTVRQLTAGLSALFDQNPDLYPYLFGDTDGIAR